MIKKTLAGTAAAVGAAAVLGSVASGGVKSPWYVALDKPAIQPPGPVFPIVCCTRTLRSVPPS
jgi:translocator protein